MDYHYFVQQQLVECQLERAAIQQYLLHVLVDICMHVIPYCGQCSLHIASFVCVFSTHQAHQFSWVKAEVYHCRGGHVTLVGGYLVLLLIVKSLLVEGGEVYFESTNGVGDHS